MAKKISAETSPSETESKAKKKTENVKTSQPKTPPISPETPASDREKPETEKSEKVKKEEEEEALEKQKRLEAFRKAGSIHKQVMTFIRPQIKIGAKYVDLCTAAEKKILELGGEIGFPANIDVNEVAAHYTSPPDDTSIIQEGDIVKFDLGVAIDGNVADGAITVSFNTDPYTQNLILAVETAVKKALTMIKPGVKSNEIGRETQKIIKGFGYNPIKDLSGHSVEQYQVHGSKEIPNIGQPNGTPFEEGEVYALECFASTGAGNIHRGGNCFIFALDPGAERIPIRVKLTRQVLGWIARTKKTLPFSIRELLEEFPTGRFALRELTNAGKLNQFYELKEQKGTYVAQYEHTFMVTADGIEIFT